MMKRNWKRVWTAAMTLILGSRLLSAQILAEAPDSFTIDTGGEVSLFRLYNPSSGEHFYTANEKEKDYLEKAGWTYEGIGWYAPENSSKPVYRLYNPNAGDHHYTMNTKERAHLIQAGWHDEGFCWYSDENEGVPLYRQYNPNAEAGAHNYTTSVTERDYLVYTGWRDEEIGWYAQRPGEPV
ncbi:hypothetical protein [Allobaculum mucilyticum]|uniref:hypothetical protein n=1 Tax=Allobaculum mucilyticum TaxID=2834459 RepID=UPI001E42E81C|nr:hypothetical protein [Allobaculum mucilyticum]UNT96394.1 hypothetical protein KWG62_01120 [Allobaculum mucilyticum]